MKPNEYKQKFLKALCEEVDVNTGLLDEEYKVFMERLNKIKGE